MKAKFKNVSILNLLLVLFRAEKGKNNGCPITNFSALDKVCDSDIKSNVGLHLIPGLLATPVDVAVDERSICRTLLKQFWLLLLLRQLIILSA